MPQTLLIRRFTWIPRDAFISKGFWLASFVDCHNSETVMRGLDHYGRSECDSFLAGADWSGVGLSEPQLSFFFFAGGGDSERCVNGDQRAWEDGILGSLFIGASEPESGLGRRPDF